MRRGGVDLLLRDQVRTRFRDTQNAVIRKLADIVRRFCAVYLAFGAHHIQLAALLGRGCLGQFFGKLGNLQDGYKLSCANVIPHIGINGLHITGNLCVEIDFLIRTKLGRQFHSSGEILARRLHNGDLLARVVIRTGMHFRYSGTATGR